MPVQQSTLVIAIDLTCGEQSCSCLFDQSDFKAIIINPGTPHIEALPSIISLKTMQKTFAQDLNLLLDQKFNTLIQNQLALLPQEDAPLLTSQLLQNITMGVALGDDKVISVLQLFYRVNNRGKSKRGGKQISTARLLQWLESQVTQAMLAEKITDSIGQEHNLRKGSKQQEGDEDQVDLQLSPMAEQNGEHLSCSEDKKKHRQMSPAITEQTQKIDKDGENAEEQIKIEENADQEAYEEQKRVKDQQEQVFLDSDLFEVLNQLFKQDEKKLKNSQHKVQEQEVQQDNLHESEHETSPKRPHPFFTCKEQTEFNQLEHASPRKSPRKEHCSQHSSPLKQSFTLLKLTEQDPKDEQESNLMSQVSSFTQENYLNLCHYQLQDTQRYGHLLYGDKVDKILRSFNTPMAIYMLIKWKPRKNGQTPFESILESEHLKNHCPHLLIDYYRSQACK